MYGATPSASGALTLGAELGKGGEGSVYSVKEHSIPGLLPAAQLVAKIYHEPTLEERSEKLKSMIVNPVTDPAVAWPLAVVLDSQKRFQGYLMKRLESSSYREWLYVANAKDRRKVAPSFDVRYAYAAVRNLAAALLAVHAAGHRVGDLNESNVFLGADATVLIVDTDSMQVLSSNGRVFPCAVGKPEFTAPELTHGSLRETPRTEETDIFAFAVAAYQLLTGGATPHQGAFDPTSDDDPLPTVERIRRGVLPALKPQEARSYGFTPRPGVPVNALPGFLRAHLSSFLSVSPASRNTARSLVSLIGELDAFIPQLIQCQRVRNHWYPVGESCGWCESAAKSGIDPWAGEQAAPPPAQARLKPISFQDGSSPEGPARAPAAVAGTPTPPVQQYSGAPQSAYAGQSSQQSSSPPPTPQGQTPHQQHQQASSPVAQRPHKVKGKVTVAYRDGTWGVRPPLGVLLRQRPKLALWAMGEETPSLLKFWWPGTRDLAHPGGLAAGAILGLLVALLWQPGALLGFSLLPFIQLSPALLSGLAWIPVGTAAFAVIFMLFAALRDRIVTAKRAPLSNFKRESFWKTALRFAPLGFFYGVPIVLILGGLLLYLLLVFIRAVGKA